MVSLILKQAFQRTCSLSRPTFRYASSSPVVQRHIIQEDGNFLSYDIKFRYCMNLIDVVRPTHNDNNNKPMAVDDPMNHDDYFNVRSMVTLEDLFK